MSSVVSGAPPKWRYSAASLSPKSSACCATLYSTTSARCRGFLPRWPYTCSTKSRELWPISRETVSGLTGAPRSRVASRVEQYVWRNILEVMAPDSQPAGTVTRLSTFRKSVSIPSPPWLKRGKSEPRRRPVGVEHVGPEDLLQLRPERDRALRGPRLEPRPGSVLPEPHRPVIEGHVGHLEPEHLGAPAPGQQERRDERIHVSGDAPRRRRQPGGLQEERRLVHLQPCRFLSLRTRLVDQRGGGIVAERDDVLTDGPAVEVAERIQVHANRAAGDRAAAAAPGRPPALPCRRFETRSPKVIHPTLHVGHADRLDAAVIPEELACPGEVELDRA